MTEHAGTPVAALRRSHTQLAALVGGLSATAIEGPSYASEWTIAQVLSHLGSGAEIGLLAVAAARAGDEPPAQDALEAVWDRWNAKSPADQAADCPGADRRLVEALEAIGPDEAGGLTFHIGPMELDTTGYARLRLAEHAVHVWDVAVMGDPAATVDEVAVDQLMEVLPMLAGFVGRSTGEARRVRVTTTGPDQDLLLDVGADSLRLGPWDGGDEPARLLSSAEALLRLVYGRLDPAHTPASVETSGVGLDDLRALFPGF
ncbi:MAG: maleylpyruvate isomerase N-terminal domain-containing protein [Actinomycetota bacterium]|nr:maleylpyruvate isomerase N-terminal domain-containing protein [Actinomycetota bacterium]